jgi:hypothetical protein
MRRGAGQADPDRRPAGVDPFRRSPAVRDLLVRAGGELERAERASEPAARFLHAHLGALRAASAVVAARGLPSTRRRPVPVWDLLAAAAPELGAWAAYFRGGAGVRAALEAGREVALSGAEADHVLDMARTFLEVVLDASLARAS